MPWNPGVLSPVVRRIIFGLQIIVVAASVYLVFLPNTKDLFFRWSVLVMALASFGLYYLAPKITAKPLVAQWLWAFSWAFLPMAVAGNITVLVFAWVLPTWVVVPVVGLGFFVAIYRLNLTNVCATPTTLDRFVNFGSGGVTIGIVIVGSSVFASCVFGLTGEPSPSPDCAVIERIKGQLEAGSFPLLNDADLACLRESFERDAAHLVIQDTVNSRHGSLHPQSHSSSFLVVHHPEDSTRYIPGPSGEIRPVRNAYKNNKNSLKDGRWIHWTSLGPQGLPGANLPPDTSYGLLIRLGSTENVDRLIDSLRARKAAEIRERYAAWHDALPHEHLNTAPTPPNPGDHVEPDSLSRYTNFRYKRGELVKIHIPARGNDYRINLVRYFDYDFVSNNRDMALWLEHSHMMPCEACEIHGWCTEE